MTKNPGRWIVPDIGFHAGALNWLLVVVTSVLLFAPWVAGQSAIFAPPGSFQFESSIRLSPTMTIVLVCLMGTIFLVACVIVYVRQFVDRRMPQNFTLGDDGVRRHGPRGLDPAVTDSFPAFIYSDVKGLKIGKAALECAVCLNEFEDDETLRLLPQCNHVFHRDCVDTWLSSHITCPVCRANLNPKPGESLPVTVLSHDPESELDHHHTTYSPDFHEPQNQNLDLIVGDSIIPTQSPGLFDAIQTRNRNGSPRSTSRKEGATGRKLRRSCSTGESIVKAGENCEKFTLRLPEEVRNGLVRSGLSRTRSCCVAFPRARSLRKGYRSSSGGTGRGRSFYYEWFDQDWRFDRWEFMAAPPFFSRAASARSPTVISGGEKLTTPKNLLKSVTSPLYGLFWGTDKNEQGINFAETSFDRPRFGGLV